MNAKRVRDLMSPDNFTALPEHTLDSLERLLTHRHVHLAPVVDEHQVLLGVVTDRDLLRHTLLGRPGVPRETVEADLRSSHVREIMDDVPTVTSPEEDLGAAAARMLARDCDALPVVEDGNRLVGLLTAADFVRWFAVRDAAPQPVRRPRGASRRR